MGFFFSLFLVFSPKEQGLILVRNFGVCSFFLRRYSIATPSLLHRKSIVSMEYLWRTDGQVMEKPKRFRYAKYLYLGLFSVCFHNSLDLFGGFRKKCYLCIHKIRDIRQPLRADTHYLMFIFFLLGKERSCYEYICIT